MNGVDVDAAVRLAVTNGGERGDLTGRVEIDEAKALGGGVAITEVFEIVLGVLGGTVLLVVVCIPWGVTW